MRGCRCATSTKALRKSRPTASISVRVPLIMRRGRLTNSRIAHAASKAPSQARIFLREHLLTASAAFDEKSSAGKKKATAAPPVKPGATPPISLPIDTVPFSFNPIVRLEWPLPEKLYVETAYISLRSELIKTFSRWHMLTLSPQAAVLGRG